MKKDIGKKIKLGIFLTFGIIILIIGIYFIGEGQQLFRSTFQISGVFKDVAGLQAGNNVRLSGINIGTVKNVSIISDTTVRVEIVIDEGIRKFIKKDAVAIIGSEGLMGNKVLVINPGTGGKKMIEDNDVIETIVPVSVDDIFQSLNTTITNANLITGDLASITSNIESGEGTIGKLVMDKAWRQDFDAIFINLKNGSAGFKTLMDKANDMDEILLSFKSSMENTANITHDLSVITNNIQSGKGAVGRLFMNQAAAQNIDSTFIYLKEGSAAFKELIEKAQGSWLLWGF